MRRKNLVLKGLVILMALFMLLAPSSWAVPAAPITSTLIQPDGTKFKARLKGDEWNNWVATEEGYTILKDVTSGYWVYANQLDLSRGAGIPTPLIKSSLKVGIDAPVGIGKGLIPESSIIDHYRFPPSSVAGEPDIPPLAPPVSGSGDHKVLVILVEFDDQAITTSEADWAASFFGASSSVKDYYDEVSYSNLNILPAEEDYGTADDGIVKVNVGYNHPNTGGFGVVNQQLTKDALVVADSYVVFSSFDDDSSYSLSTDELHVVIIAAGYEASLSGACTPNVWGHRMMLGGSVSAPTLDGVSVGDRYANGGYTQWGELHDRISDGCGTGLSYMATIGIMVHELGHDLWLPDEYDVDGSSQGIGRWGIMGGGSWNSVTRLGDSPAHPVAWDKWYEGWLTPTQITSSNTVSIAQVETSATVYQLLDNPGGVNWSYLNNSGTGEYFLVENRQQTGYDAGLPDCGILIWHIDETVTYGYGSNIDEWGRRLVALEQADGLFDLENSTNGGDTGDPYRSGDSFDPTTTPDSNLYNGSGSGVSVVVNDNCGTNMSVTFVVDMDEDGVPDTVDNCPDDANPGQEDTYPPQGNGIGDACDCECDFDCSGGVDANDVSALLFDFGRSTFNNPCTNADPCNGDVDCNVNVDADDVTNFLTDFGRSQFNNPCPPCVAGDWCVY